MPHENPNAYRNRTIDINNGDSSSGQSNIENNAKCNIFVTTLKKFVNKLIESYLDNFKIVNRIPIRFLSEEDDNGYVKVTTLLGEVDTPFKVLNKSGEIITSGEFGYLEYRKNATKGWISMRNGKPKPKYLEYINEITKDKCYTLTTQSAWETMIKNKTIDEDMLYIFIDDDMTQY